MSDFPKQFVPNLEIWTPDMAEGADFGQAIAGLNERGIVAARGVTLELAGALGVVAHQKHIVEFCEGEPDRYGTIRRTANWVQKGREAFSLHQVDGHEGPLSDDDLDSVQDGDLHLLAYGASGPKVNQHILGADITTLYRVTELGRRKGLAEPLLRFVVGATLLRHSDINPEDISLETWDDNRRALKLYEDNHFTKIAEIRDERGTLRPVGDLVNGHQVRVDPKDEGRHVVVSNRRFYRNDPMGRFADAA